MAKISLTLVAILLTKLVSGARFSVSGLSSGADMSTQMHVAYSSYVEGAGIIAGSPYFCGKKNKITADSSCMLMPWLIDLKTSVQYAKDQSSLQTIDDVTNLQNSKVWIYSGLLDTVRIQPVVKETVKFYREFGLEASTKFDMPSEHAWITNNFGNLCNILLYPYINDCLYDAAEKILKTIYGDHLSKGKAKTENLHLFDQTKYIEAPNDMDDYGYIYIPDACKDDYSKCRIHVAFHGCEMGADFAEDYFAKHSGLNRWAEGSYFIVIYPQVKKNIHYNAAGCWDWWGYTGIDYALKSGPQMKTVFSMTQSLPLVSELLTSI